jgi:uncharacterized Ntn-hydrolase superfamily protein
MTWSIVARDASGALGVAVASKFFAVGALCAHGQSGVGALSTQALVNPLLAAPALRGMAARRKPDDLISELMASDPGQALRQIHMVDNAGRGAAHTGAGCIEWCGHTLRDGYSVAGNMLAGPQVIAATADSYAAHPELPFAERLIEALSAGEAVGGDKRGKQAAALLVYSGQDYPALDIRVDDHLEPILELRRLFQVSLDRFQPFVSCLASHERPAGIIDRSVIEAEIARFQATRKKSAGSIA